MSFESVFLPIISVLATALLGANFIRKYYVSAKEAKELILDLAEALKDGKITKDEIQELIGNVKSLKKAIKKARHA